MFKQTETKYKNIKLGFGEGSLYDYGCYLISLCNGLNANGYQFTPEGLNDMLKGANAFVGPYRNYIDIDNLHKYFPNIFESYQKIDPWNDVPPSWELVEPNTVTLGRVSAKPIGGTGDHFVLFERVELKTVRIYDPWSGVSELITKRWGTYGNILGIRIFKIKPYLALPLTPIPPLLNDQTHIPLGIIEKTDYGSPELQAVRGIIGDHDREIRSLKGSEEYLKGVLASLSKPKPLPTLIPIPYDSGLSPWARINRWLTKYFG